VVITIGERGVGVFERGVWGWGQSGAAVGGVHEDAVLDPIKTARRKVIFGNEKDRSYSFGFYLSSDVAN
jgi:hypothetical protein